ncbi:MAG: MFS transporter [Lactobacillus sp.]|nr:MFS transporter [Lactobacillus sp.]
MTSTNVVSVIGYHKIKKGNLIWWGNQNYNYILRVTGSSLAFSVILLLSPVALLVSSPFVGTIVDRTARKRVVLWAQSASILVVLVMYGAFSLVKAPLLQVVVAGSVVFCLTLCDNF